MLAYCHVSTCYVNSNLPQDAVIEEEIYQKDQEIERLVSQVMQMNPRQVEEQLSNIIGGYANTYCFTKALFERTMNKKVGNMPSCIVRPSMVGPSVSEPYEGWIDTLAAVGGPIFFGGLGVFNYQLGTGKQVFDMTAVDQVVNHIIVATAHCSIFSDKMHIFNHSSTTVNAPDQILYNDSMNKFYKYHPFDR